MQIFCSSEFTKNLKLLTKTKYSNTYGTLKNEITTFFKEYDTFEKVWNKSYLLRENNVIRLNKVRLENPCQNAGKSGGFRMVMICDNRSQTVGLLCVYPKTGPHGRSDTPDDLLHKIVKAYKKEKQENLLVEYHI